MAPWRPHPMIGKDWCKASERTQGRANYHNVLIRSGSAASGTSWNLRARHPPPPAASPLPPQRKVQRTLRSNVHLPSLVDQGPRTPTRTHAPRAQYRRPPCRVCGCSTLVVCPSPHPCRLPRPAPCPGGSEALFFAVPPPWWIKGSSCAALLVVAPARTLPSQPTGAPCLRPCLHPCPASVIAGPAGLPLFRPRVAARQRAPPGVSHPAPASPPRAGAVLNYVGQATPSKHLSMPPLHCAPHPPS
jgi:hypothetical protein